MLVHVCISVQNVIIPETLKYFEEFNTVKELNIIPRY